MRLSSKLFIRFYHTYIDGRKRMNVQSQVIEKDWWNQPIFGNVTLVERLMGAVNPESVPEIALSLHNTELEELNRLSLVLDNYDSKKFKEEFLFYISVKKKLEKNKEEYKGLSTFIKIIQFAIAKHGYFQKLRRIELDYRENSLLDLYKFIDEQLNNNLDRFVFMQNVSRKAQQIASKETNKLVKSFVFSYVNYLKKIAENQIGINLLLLLKKYQIADYKVFEVTFSIFNQCKKEDLQDLQLLTSLVESNHEEMKKIGRLIGISNKNNQSIVYAKIFQYIALAYKYQKVEERFYLLRENLINWEKHYKILISIRQEYPKHNHKLPKEFTSIIPGESIYQKYQNYLFLG